MLPARRLALIALTAAMTATAACSSDPAVSTVTITGAQNATLRGVATCKAEQAYLTGRSAAGAAVLLQVNANGTVDLSVTATDDGDARVYSGSADWDSTMSFDRVELDEPETTGVEAGRDATAPAVLGARRALVDGTIYC